MKTLVSVIVAVCVLALVRCGGGSAGDPRGVPPGNKLEGTWSGSLFEVGWFVFHVDGWGDVTVLESGQGSTLGLSFTGGSVVPGTDPPRLILDSEQIGPLQFAFLLDAEEKHGTLAPMTWILEIIPFGAFERDAGIRPIYYAPDIRGSFSGYGYAYSQPDLDFRPFSPVTTTATEGTPHDRFSVTLPAASFTGDLDGGLLSLNLWAGVVDGTGARFLAVLSYDKQFVSVLAAPTTVTGVHDLSYYALSRD